MNAGKKRQGVATILFIFWSRSEARRKIIAQTNSTQHRVELLGLERNVWRMPREKSKKRWASMCQVKALPTRYANSLLFPMKMIELDAGGICTRLGTTELFVIFVRKKKKWKRYCDFRLLISRKKCKISPETGCQMDFTH